MIKNFDTYKLVEYIDSLGLNLSQFHLKDDQFDHKSSVHGINHTYRVMFNCLLIGYKINDKANAKRAFMAAYIHDMARKHDMHCDKHGIESSDKKLPLYKKLFEENGMTEDDIKAISLAVYNHSSRNEVSTAHPFYKTVAILRDADGLDLCRIDIAIRHDILRFKESIDLIKITEEFYIETDFEKYNSFNQYMTDALNIINNFDYENANDDDD